MLNSVNKWGPRSKVDRRGGGGGVANSNAKGLVYQGGPGLCDYSRPENLKSRCSSLLYCHLNS